MAFYDFFPRQHSRARWICANANFRNEKDVFELHRLEQWTFEQRPFFAYSTSVHTFAKRISLSKYRRLRGSLGVINRFSTRYRPSVNTSASNGSSSKGTWACLSWRVLRRRLFPFQNERSFVESNEEKPILKFGALIGSTMAGVPHNRVSVSRNKNSETPGVVPGCCLETSDGKSASERNKSARRRGNLQASNTCFCNQWEQVNSARCRKLIQKKLSLFLDSKRNFWWSLFLITGESRRPATKSKSRCMSRALRWLLFKEFV